MSFTLIEAFDFVRIVAATELQVCEGLETREAFSLGAASQEMLVYLSHRRYWLCTQATGIECNDRLHTSHHKRGNTRHWPCDDRYRAEDGLAGASRRTGVGKAATSKWSRRVLNDKPFIAYRKFSRKPFAKKEKWTYALFIHFRFYPVTLVKNVAQLAARDGLAR
jgi:hypothetical protein